MFWNINKQDSSIQLVSWGKVKVAWASQLLTQKRVVTWKILMQRRSCRKLITESCFKKKIRGPLGLERQEQQTHLKNSPALRKANLTCFLWRKTQGKISQNHWTSKKIRKNHHDEQEFPKVAKIKRQENHGVRKGFTKDLLSKPTVSHQSDKGVVSQG